jgi:hypothetical protein
VGASKSLPAIVKHLLTLFRYVFPAQIVKFYVLDSFSNSYWSMSCLSNHTSSGDTSSITFSDSSGENITEQLLAKVIETKSSVVVRDTVFDNSTNHLNSVSDKINEISEATVSIPTKKNKQKRGRKRQSFMSSSTKSNPIVTKFMSELSDPTIIEEWKLIQEQQMKEAVTSGVIIPLMDTTNGGGFNQSFDQKNKNNGGGGGGGGGSGGIDSSNIATAGGAAVDTVETAMSDEEQEESDLDEDEDPFAEFERELEASRVEEEEDEEEEAEEEVAEDDDEMRLETQEDKM